MGKTKETKETKTTINFEPRPGTVLCRMIMKEAKTLAGIILSTEGDEGAAEIHVVAVGQKCEWVKEGDQVLAVGNYNPLLLDGIDYIQIYETQIMGKVLNGGEAIVMTKGSTTKEY